MVQNVPTAGASAVPKAPAHRAGLAPASNPLSPAPDSAHVRSRTGDADAGGGDIEMVASEPSAQDVVEHATDVASPTEIDLEQEESGGGSAGSHGGVQDHAPTPLVSKPHRVDVQSQTHNHGQGGSLMIPGLHMSSDGNPPSSPARGGHVGQSGPQVQTAADMVGVQQGVGEDQASRVLDATRNMVADRLLPIYGDKRVGGGQAFDGASAAGFGPSEAALDDGLPHEAIQQARTSGHENYLLSEFVGTGSTDEATAMSAFKISSRFAAGRLFAAGALENVVISIFFSHAVVWLLHELSGGNRLRVQFHHIPPQLYGAPYGALYEHVVEVEELVPMGLYRDGSHTNNALPYVQTNPGLDEFVREGDLLFVLAPKARFPRGQAADAIRLGTAAVAAAEVAAGSAQPKPARRARSPQAAPRMRSSGAAPAVEEGGGSSQTKQAGGTSATSGAAAEDSDDSFSD